MSTINFPTGDFVTSSLTGSIDASQDTATIGAGLTLPATNGVLVIDYDSTAAVGVASGPETITYATYTTATGALAGITRGLAGTTGVTHANAASVQCSSSAVLYTEVSDRLTAVQAGAALALVDGWQDPAETWTYASGTTITVPAGNLTKRSVGDKIKLDQSVPLTAYFPLEDKDSDVGTFTVADVGTPTYTAGKFSNALTLNGTDQALSITDAAGFKPTGAFTLGFWMKTATKDRTIFQSYSDNTNSNGLHLGTASVTGYLVLSVGNNAASASSTVVGTTDMTDNAFHYVVISSQGNFTKIFVDGVLNASGYTVTPTYHATNYVRIGVQCVSGASVAGTWYAGQIDDLFLINGFAVDAAWVAAKYAADTAQSTANITPTQYFYVTAVADQLLTVTGGADYVLYNATISTPYYSKASSPVGFPDDFACAPAGTGFASKTSDIGAFSMKGRDVRLYVNIAGVSNANTLTFTAPIAAKRTQFQGVFRTIDNSADQATMGTLSTTAASATMTAFKDLPGNVWTTSNNKKIEGTIIYAV